MRGRPPSPEPPNAPPDRSVKIRGMTYERIRRVAVQNRMPVVEMIDVMATRWDQSTLGEQVRAIRGGHNRQEWT